MSRGEHADLGRDRPEIRRATTVDADALVDDALAHQLLREAANRFLDLLVATGELARRLGGAGEGGDGLGHDCVGGGVAVGLLRDRDRLAELRGGHALHGLPHVVAVVEDLGVRQRLDRAMGGDVLCHQVLLERDRVLDVLLRGLEATGQHGLVDLRRTVGVVGEALLGATGFDHHDGDVAVVEHTPGDDELEGCLVALGVGRVRGPRAVLAEGEADSADGAVERDAAQHERRRSSVDGEHVVRVLLVGTEHGDHDLGFVPVPLREGGPQWAVRQAAGEDRPFGGPALPPEEGAGDLAGGVRPLLDVHGQWEEVHAFTHVLGRVRRGEHGGAADGGDNGPLGLERELAGLE